jgi:hypothetical protein
MPRTLQIESINSNSNLTFSTSSTGATIERLRIDSTGNVGIGVTPSAWSASYVGLQIGGSTSIWTDKAAGLRTFISTNLFFDGTNRKYIATGASSEYLQGTDGSHVWYSAASGSAGSNITFTERLRIDSSGNVGIGTASPSALLHVSGSGATAVKINGGTSANQGPFLKFQKNSTDTLILGVASAILGGGSTSNDSMIYTEGTNNTIFYNNAAERLRIDSSGNVGIGTASPLTKLDVRGVGYVSELNVNYGIGTNGNAIINGGTNLYLRPQSGALICETSGAERLRIDSSGNVGVGTSNPVSVLDISKASDTSERAIKVQNSSSDLYVGTEGTSGNRFSGSSANNVFLGTTSAAGIEFATNNTVRVKIDSSGNVGIGSASPATKLHVNGVITHSAGTIGSNANGTRTVTTTTTTPTGGSDGDIYYII